MAIRSAPLAATFETAQPLKETASEHSGLGRGSAQKTAERNHVHFQICSTCLKLTCGETLQLHPSTVHLISSRLILRLTAPSYGEDFCWAWTGRWTFGVLPPPCPPTKGKHGKQRGWVWKLRPPGFFDFRLKHQKKKKK